MATAVFFQLCLIFGVLSRIADGLDKDRKSFVTVMESSSRMMGKFLSFFKELLEAGKTNGLQYIEPYD
jgi:hypothetical protein